MLRILVLLVSSRVCFNCSQIMTSYICRKRPYVYIHVMNLFKYLVQQPERWKSVFFPTHFGLFQGWWPVHTFLQIIMSALFIKRSPKQTSPIWISIYPQFFSWRQPSSSRCSSLFLTNRNNLDRHVGLPDDFFSSELSIHWLPQL